MSKSWTSLPERTREGHRQLDKHWNRFKEDVGEISERGEERIWDFSEHIDTIFN